jgi:hypothetical protein
MLDKDWDCFKLCQSSVCIGMEEYIPEDCNQTKDNLVTIDPKKVANFKKITRPDTIRSIKEFGIPNIRMKLSFLLRTEKILIIIQNCIS